MKKKSMITALVLSVAMIGISTGGVLAADSYSVGTGYTATADGSNSGSPIDPQIRVRDGGNEVVDSGDWESGDSVSLNGGTLNVSGYGSNANGTLSALTTGTVNLTGGTLTIGSGSSVQDAVTMSTSSGTTLLINGGSAAIGGGSDNIAGYIDAQNGNLTVNGTNINIGTGSSVANAVNLNVAGTLGVNGGTVNIGSGDTISGTINATSGSLIFNNASTLDSHYNVSGSTNVTNNGTLTISQNISTTGTLSNAANSTLTNTSTSTVGTLSNGNNGTINGGGNLTAGGGTNNGTIEQSSLTLTGDYTNNGSINVNTLSNSAALSGANGKITANGGSNSGSITQDSLTLTGNFANTGSINVNTLTNSAALSGTNGTITAAGGSNSGSITQNSLTLTGDFANTGSINVGTLNNSAALTGTNGRITAAGGSNSGSITQNSLSLTGSYENTGSINVNTFNNSGALTGANGTVTTTNGTNSGSITQGTFEVANGGNYNNNGSMNVTTLNVGTGATLNNSGVTDATTGDMVNASIVAQTIANNGEITLNNADLSVTSGNLGGTVSAVGGTSSMAVGGQFTGTLNVGSDSVTGAILNVTQNNILPEANVHIYKDNTLNLGDETTSVTAILGNGDTWDGDLNNHSNSVISIVDGKDFGTVGYSQDGTGVLNVTEGAAIRVKDASKIEDGTINVASDATFASAANGFNVERMNTAGTIGALNGARETYNATNTVIGTAPGQTAGDSQADFTIDILARGNHRNETDHFNGGNISAADGEGTINISDWDLNGDIYGWDAPIDRNIDLTNVFTGTVTDNSTINYTTTDKEVFTPIGWYKLNTATPGSYTFDMTRFNPWVFRGQVTKIAQHQNQLAIDDMLFTHSMVLPSFKENDHGANASILANRYAAGSPLYAPYEYSRKDGGVWCKMYGNFEHLNMNRGFNVENNSFGALIGADLGLKELRNGWTFMPTAYVGYNGAHQNYSRNSAWQNGGQAGFLGTWYKDNFIIGALVYGGVYNNQMDTPRGDDNSFNYFGGGSVKTAYNWRFHRDWVLQPNFLVAYNYFGKENWHSDFGQMGMMSGQLHGVNVAPGLNLIWEKETFSAYATLQYMYNVNQAVGGRAGNVGLPHVHMDRGYIQYGLGFNKRFGDRFSGYLQAVFRNVGRTGVGFQGGFNFALGKKPSNYDAKLNGHTPNMQKAKVKMSSSHS